MCWHMLHVCRFQAVKGRVQNNGRTGNTCALVHSVSTLKVLGL
jgi:hypothetical protein